MEEISKEKMNENQIDNGTDSDDTFDGFNSDDINSDDGVGGQQATATASPSESDSESDIEQEIIVSEGEVSQSDSDEDCQDESDFVVNPPEWTDNFVTADFPYFSQATGEVFPGDFDCATATALDFLQLFIPDTFLEGVLKNTNCYARRRRREKGSPEEQYWKEPLTLEELKAYLGLCVLFGISPMPAYHLYWSKSPYFGNDGVKRVMAKRRYEKINEYLHVSDPQSDFQNDDKLRKVRPILNLCEEKFPKFFLPREHHSIDEAMIACKSRVEYLQYMPDKPKKRGVKVFLRCDSKTGYMCQFEVYLGKRASAPGPNGIYFDIVDRLTRPIRGRNHRVIFDNLYTGIPILQMLQSHRIFACGTIRPNRKFLHVDISSATKAGKARGWFQTLQDKKNPQMTISAWNDTKMVRYCSTMSRADVESQCLRRSGNMHIQVKRPQVSEHYAEHMGGVDICDQSKAKYR